MAGPKNSHIQRYLMLAVSDILAATSSVSDILAQSETFWLKSAESIRMKKEYTDTSIDDIIYKDCEK